MPRNIEVKAKLRNYNDALRIATELCGSRGVVLNQKDVFFNAANGRLKLRIFEDDISQSQLISYTRPDIKGPKVSDYTFCNIDNPDDLRDVLSVSLGVQGVVKKKRILFIYGQTRIHIDSVRGKGDFIEFEVELADDQDSADGEEISDNLLDRFGIPKVDLIARAYIDLD